MPLYSRANEELIFNAFGYDYPYDDYDYECVECGEPIDTPGLCKKRSCYLAQEI